MQETQMILSECEEINSLLYKPIVATQRIKYTCLNVSAKYIVLGSTSGSLYLFIRESCTFQQLIPLSEGPVSCVVISPDEKTIALATKRGSVCLVALKPTVKLLAVSSEHLGELVTSLCWNDNSSEIYIGDGIGKISTMVLTIFTVNGMFQPPSCALMHLDSTIVQMHVFGHLLLVSTMTRCYICDTSQEQFKQIGNKARDGEFGACFLEKFVERNNSPLRGNRAEGKVSSRKGTFNFISESNGDARDDQDLKIYCARPGCRLWEVTANGIVVKTHQFKDALAIPPSSVYRPTTTVKSTQNRLSEQTSQTSQATNFSHLYVLCGKYLFSCTSNGIYIIDPTNAAVILWNNEYANISMARTIDDRIYLMTDSGIFHCLTLSSPESLILQLYEKKRYNECLRACNVLRPELVKSIGIKDASRQNGSIETTDNSTTPTSDVTAALVPLISLIQSNINTQPIKLNSGIVVVNAGNGKLRNDEIRNFEKALKTKSGVNDDLNNYRETKNGDENGLLITDMDPVISEHLVKKREKLKAPDDEDGNVREICIDSMAKMSLNDNHDESPEVQKEVEERAENRRVEDLRSNLVEIVDVTSNIQTHLNPVYVLINSLKPSMNDSEIEDAVLNIRKTMSEINENYGKIEKLKDFLYEILRSTERHYYNVLLENASTELLAKTRRSSRIVDEISRAFVDVNLSIADECSDCGYVYADKIRASTEPRFLEIGRSLVERFACESTDDCTKLCNSVPYMWRVFLPLLAQKNSITDEILSMCLRAGDSAVLSVALPAIDTRQWRIAAKIMQDLEEGACPGCGKKDENPNSRSRTKIDWSQVAREIVKRDGPTAAMNFLALVETVLPNMKLDRSIFQSLIFTKILDHHGLQHTVEFDRKRTANNEYESMCSPKVQEQLSDTLEKDLERPVDRNIFGIGSHHWGMRFQAKSSTCPCCTLSLQTPVLLGNNGISLFPCGHAYHVNCLIQRKLTRCNLH